MLDKCRKAQIFILLLISWPVWGQEKSAALQQYEELEHINRGCPENSQCDEQMGKLLSNYQRVLQDSHSKTRPQELELGIKNLIENFGWPTEFYLTESAAQTFAPVTSSSRCAFHKKHAAGALLKGRAFLRGSENGHALFRKGDTDYRLKLDDGLVIASAHFYPSAGAMKSYLLPLNERPLFISQDQLMVLGEFEDFYVLLSIPSEGIWSARSVPSEVTPFLDAQEEVPCPSNALAVPSAFQKSICRKITDEALRPAGVIQLFWDCP